MDTQDNKIDFLAIGDIVVDEFIHLLQAEELVNHGTLEICMSFGDKIPYESATLVPAVGNSPNAAVSSARLGLRTALIANVGNDEHGNACLDSLQKDKVISDYVTVEKSKATNHHYVLWYDVDRTILIKHTAFTCHLPQLPKIGWVYLSSLADHTLPYHLEIIDWLKKNPETKLAFQPGTFQIKLGAEKLKEIYQRTEIFFSNVEEAGIILGKENTDKNILELSKGIGALGPKMVCISDGPKGAYLYLNNELWQMPIYPDIAPPYERTGAGDAFSSTFTAALALGKSHLEAFAWGPINSMSVVQKIGAQAGLLSRPKLEEYLQNAPGGYKAEKI